jgi:gas vesicle protein|tara:strand:+ start:4420 stop:4641 length:222 start_codon:yes stop_codon:yes gene_type:complete
VGNQNLLIEQNQLAIDLAKAELREEISQKDITTKEEVSELVTETADRYYISFEEVVNELADFANEFMDTTEEG